MALEADLRFQRRRNFGSEDFSPEPNSVRVTIGLFTIIKLFRIVNLSVESRGFCVPDECEEISPTNACEFFEDLDFPLDIFDPPQKKEFIAGISGDIPKKKREKDERCHECGEREDVEDVRDDCDKRDDRDRRKDRDRRHDR